MIFHAVMPIFRAPRMGDLSLTHPNPLKLLQKISHTQECSLQPSLAYFQIQILSWPISRAHLPHTRTHTPIIRLSGVKKRRRNPKWVTFDPLQQPKRERVMTVREELRREKKDSGRAARRTEVPRAGNTVRLKPLEWSLHQSSRHNLRLTYSIPKRPCAYGLMTARIR